MEEKKIQRLILKDDDILVVKLSNSILADRSITMRFYEGLRKKLLPRKNKILMLPKEVELAVIGKEEIKEYISNIDLWNLFDEDHKNLEEI